MRNCIKFFLCSMVFSLCLKCEGSNVDMNLVSDKNDTCFSGELLRGDSSFWGCLHCGARNSPYEMKCVMCGRRYGAKSH